MQHARLRGITKLMRLSQPTRAWGKKGDVQQGLNRIQGQAFLLSHQRSRNASPPKHSECANMCKFIALDTRSERQSLQSGSTFLEREKELGHHFHIRKAVKPSRLERVRVTVWR